MSASCISLLTHPVYILLDYEENEREILVSLIGLSLTVLETPLCRYADALRHISALSDHSLLVQ